MPIGIDNPDGFGVTLIGGSDYRWMGNVIAIATGVPAF